MFIVVVLFVILYTQHIAFLLPLASPRLANQQCNLLACKRTYLMSDTFVGSVVVIRSPPMMLLMMKIFAIVCEFMLFEFNKLKIE